LFSFSYFLLMMTKRRRNGNVGENLRGSYGVLPYELKRRACFIDPKLANAAERGSADAPVSPRSPRERTEKEPSTYAALFGAAALGFAIFRRCRVPRSTVGE
jgi:hypothetical protein